MLTVKEVDKQGFQLHIYDTKIRENIHFGAMTLQESLDKFHPLSCVRIRSMHLCILRAKTGISALASDGLKQLGKLEASDTVFHWILGDSSFVQYCANLEKAL